jgi:hypothetical protein
VLQYMLMTWKCCHGSIARQVLCGVSRDAYRMCLTSKVLLSNVFIYIGELSDTEQSLT